MKKVITLLSLVLISLFPRFLSALTNEQQEGWREINQRWVDLHNEALSDEVKADVKKIKAKKHAFVLSSVSHRHTIPMRRLRLRAASKAGIPFEVKSREGFTTPLVALYQAKIKFEEVGDHAFLIADYADELDPLHSSSDVYMKIGLRYQKMFHGEGYKGCARVISLERSEKTRPIFFEVGYFGGGSRVDRILYALNKDAVKNMPQDLYDHPEDVKPADYVQDELKFSIWLEGLTSYKELEKDGSAEIVNFTEVQYPESLKTKLKLKYGMEDNDFAGPFRRAVSIYHWNNEKLKFEDLGDYYY
jgi:hypothetical protein